VRDILRKIKREVVPGAKANWAARSVPFEPGRPGFTGDRRYVFLTGCGRSGTTALTFLVNQHPDIGISFERYGYVAERDELTPEHFPPERFDDFREGDTHHKHYSGNPARAGLLEKYHACEVVGDKLPHLIGHMDQLDRFPGVKVVFIIRQPFAVAKSFNARAADPDDAWSADHDYSVAVGQFNEAMQDLEKLLAKGHDVLILDYDRLFQQRYGLEALWSFIDVDPAKLPSLDGIFEQAESLKDKRKDDLTARAVSLGADFETYRKMIALGESQAGDG